MLARENRLTRSESFRLAVRSGQRAARPTLVVHHLSRPGEAAAAPQVGLVTGRALGGAVVRNRVKRRLRHLLRERLDRLPHGSLTVVRALPPAAGAPYAALGVDLDSAIAALTDARVAAAAGGSA